LVFDCGFFMKYVSLIIACLPLLLSGQIAPVEQDTTELKYLIIDGDTLIKKVIDLDEVLVMPRLRLTSKEERVRYLILKRKTLKVYPYAKLAAERLVELQSRLDELPRKGQKRKYARRIQKYIEEEFSAELKKLTKSEGRILIKLIHRQTGETAFQLIKQLRSGWRAFWFQNTAKLFDISLKSEYAPLEVEEDFLIEDILLRAFQDGRLDRQDPASDIDYYDLTDIWLTTENTLKKSE